MHSSPIDIVARAPKPQNAAPTETEPDGRFSELLRGPSEAAAGQPDGAANPKSKQATPIEGQPGTEVTAEIQALAEPVADPASPEMPASTDLGLSPLAIIPEAITAAQPEIGPLVVGNAADGAELQSGGPSPRAPNPEISIVAPQAPPPVSETVGASAPTGSADGVPPGPQPNSSTVPANPADRANLAIPATPVEPGNLGATARITQPPPLAAARPEMAAPAVPTGKAAAGGDSARETPPTPAATQPKAGAVDTATPDRQTPAPIPTPERLAMTRAAVPAMAEPPKSPDVAVPPETRESKVGSQPMRTIPNTAAPATTSSASEKSSAAATTAVPSTVSEIADTSLPASQPDSNAAATPGQIGRMTATTASAIQGAHTQTAAQPAAEQVVLQLQRAVRDGVDRLTVQLKPASLGRVDVQMEVGYDGRVQAIISAERPETLHLLQRDARALTEALNDAGLQTDSGSLSFNLRGQSGDHAGGNGRAPSDAARAELSNTADDIDQAATQITLTLGDGRVDIKV